MTFWGKAVDPWLNSVHFCFLYCHIHIACKALERESPISWSCCWEVWFVDWTIEDRESGVKVPCYDWGALIGKVLVAYRKLFIYICRINFFSDLTSFFSFFFFNKFIFKFIGKNLYREQVLWPPTLLLILSL